MNAKRLVLLGQLKEAIHSKEPNMENRCRGLINELISLETEQPDREYSELSAVAKEAFGLE
jgi:hypothetical protein